MSKTILKNIFSVFIFLIVVIVVLYVGKDVLEQQEEMAEKAIHNCEMGCGVLGLPSNWSWRDCNSSERGWFIGECWKLNCTCVEKEGIRK